MSEKQVTLAEWEVQAVIQSLTSFAGKVEKEVRESTTGTEFSIHRDRLRYVQSLVAKLVAKLADTQRYNQAAKDIVADTCDMLDFVLKKATPNKVTLPVEEVEKKFGLPPGFIRTKDVATSPWMIDTSQPRTTLLLNGDFPAKFDVPTKLAIKLFNYSACLVIRRPVKESETGPLYGPFNVVIDDISVHDDNLDVAIKEAVRLWEEKDSPTGHPDPKSE